MLHRDVDWTPVRDALMASRKVHVVAHVCPDSDTIGSQIALSALLRALGVDVVMHNVDAVPRICRYLPTSELITSGKDFSHLSDCDTIVSVDAGSFSRLGLPKSYVQGKTMVNIDHHASNTDYADINKVDARYCATGAMMYDLIQACDVPLNSTMAASIYAAVVTDTSSFRNITTTADTHRMVAELLDAGADVAQASQEIYQNFRKERFDLLRDALDSLTLEHDGRSAWIAVPCHLYEASGMTGEDSEGFIDYARNIAGVRIAVFLREESPECWKMSFRSVPPYDVGRLASGLGGGGHQYAAGCMIHGSFQHVREQVCDAIGACLQS